MIGIVIPNFNGVKHLDVCFRSLSEQSYSDFKVLLIDNNSSDDSVEFVKKHYPEVEAIINPENYGFAKAVNIGINRFLDSGCEYILLLNNDIECDKNFVSEMVKGFVSDDIGSVACKMINYYNRSVIDSAGDFIKRKGSPYARGHGEPDNGQYDNPGYIFGACAGAALYKSDIFIKVGLFDEDFFAYFEDVDLDLRMQLMGYKCYYTPKAVCYHKRGATSKSRIGYETMLCEKNLLAIRIKNYPVQVYLKYQFFFAAGRIRRYYRILRYISFKTFFMAIYGYLLGLFYLPKHVLKRSYIHSNKIISNKAFEKLF
ncbi:MAG: glycosyltransferase family 2 protein [Ignavibacteriae bacterium]|nr:glycosyltransferase family 2 protein [Ignavibacteriota bacterium]